MLTVYLAGQKNETAYRDNIFKNYKNYPIKFIDPMSEEMTCDSIEEIVETDKKLILSSHVVIAYVNVYSAGTMMEIIFAWTNGIPVYLVCNNELKDDIWISYHVKETFTTIGQCISQILLDRKSLIKNKLNNEIYHDETRTYNKNQFESNELEIGEMEQNKRYGMDDSKVATKLIDKNCSPMIVRKYTRLGFPLYIHLICDEDLSDLDTVVHDVIDLAVKSDVIKNDIQSLRNFTGFMSDSINKYYDTKKRGCVESLGIIYYVDKMMISSLQGDCMNHDSCRRELYECINIMTKI